MRPRPSLLRHYSPLSLLEDIHAVLGRSLLPELLRLRTFLLPPLLPSEGELDDGLRVGNVRKCMV
jgi:hypothetical protein